MNGPTAAVGLGSIALVLALRFLKARLGWRLLPDLLLVVIAMAFAVAELGLDARGVKVVGEIPAELPRFALPIFDSVQVREFASGALAIAVLGLLEAIAMAKAIAAQTGQKLDMNQQCLSEGVANCDRQLLPVLPRLGLAHALARSTSRPERSRSGRASSRRAPSR